MTTTINSDHATADELCVILSGDLDLRTRRAVEDSIAGQLSRREYQAVVLDLSGVTYVDSAGLELIVGIHHRYPDRSAVRLLVAAGSQPDRVLRLVCFDRIVSIAAAA